MRILIAEKDSNGRRLLEQVMRLEGYEVFIAECGKQLKKLIRSIRPDVILMNVFYPLHAGGQPLDQIKVHCNGGHDPMLFVTCAGRCRERNIAPVPGETANARFDALPSALKIRVVEKLQRLCAAVIRCKRWSGDTSGLRREKTFSLGEFESIDTLLNAA